MTDLKSNAKPYKNYYWIVHDPDLLGGQPTIRNTRIPVSLVLQGLSEEMSAKDFSDDYPGFPEECITEVLKFAAEKLSLPIKDSDDDLAA